MQDRGKERVRQQFPANVPARRVADTVRYRQFPAFLGEQVIFIVRVFGKEDIVITGAASFQVLNLGGDFRGDSFGFRRAEGTGDEIILHIDDDIEYAHGDASFLQFGDVGIGVVTLHETGHDDDAGSRDVFQFVYRLRRDSAQCVDGKRDGAANVPQCGNADRRIIGLAARREHVAGNDVRRAEKLGFARFCRRVYRYSQRGHVVADGGVGLQVFQGTLKTGNVETDRRFSEGMENTLRLVNVTDLQRFFCVIKIVFFGQCLFPQYDGVDRGSGDQFDLIPKITA